MAVPIIVGGVAAASALYGTYKGTKGAINHVKAKNLNGDATSIVDEASHMVDEQRNATNAVLIDYGNRKLRAFNAVIDSFINTFGRLKNVEITQTDELDKLNIGDFSTNVLQELRADYQALKDAGLGIGAGIGGGAALAFGAYNGTMLLATASTGTAISSLGGAAATNATLAWLGGGSIASGGGGMALGSMVLGSIAVGPALAIFGHIMGNKGEQALNNARSNKEQAQTFYAEAQLIVDNLKMIGQVTHLANTTFSEISSRLRHAVHDLEDVIEQSGEDYQSFNTESREIVFRAVKFAQLLKAMIDTPILDEGGKLVLSTDRVQEFRSAIA